MDLTIYDLRSLYMLYKIQKLDSFLFTIGCVNILDQIEDEAEKLSFLNSTAKIFQGIDKIVQEGPRADKDYMTISTVTGEDRRASLRRTRMVNKSINVKFQYMELYNSIVIKYFHYNTIMKRLPNITVETLILEIKHLMKYFDTGEQIVAGSTETLLVELNAKTRELGNLRQLEKDVDHSLDVQRKSSTQIIIDEINKIDRQLLSLRNDITTSVTLPIQRLESDVSVSLVPLTNIIKQMKEEVESNSTMLSSISQHVVESIDNLKQYITIEPHATLRRELSNLSNLLTDKDKSKDLLSKEIVELSSILDAINRQMAIAKDNSKQESVAVKSSLTKMAVTIANVSDTLESLEQVQKLGEKDIITIVGKIEDLAEQLDIYKKRVFDLSDTIMNTNNKILKI